MYAPPARAFSSSCCALCEQQRDAFGANGMTRLDVFDFGDLNRTRSFIALECSSDSATNRDPLSNSMCCHRSASNSPRRKPVTAARATGNSSRESLAAAIKKRICSRRRKPRPSRGGRDHRRSQRPPAKGAVIGAMPLDRDDTRPLLATYFARHRSCDLTAALARRLSQHFRRDLFAKVAGGVGFSVLHRSIGRGDRPEPVPLSVPT